MEGLVGLYAKLKLAVNVAKSAVAPVWERSFLELQLLGGARKDREAPSLTEGPDQNEGAYPRAHVSERRAKSRASGGETSELSHGMEGLLPSRGHAERVRRRGQMAAPSIANAHAKTVETGHGRCIAKLQRRESGGAAARDRRCGSVASLVACGSTQSASHRALPSAYFDLLGVPRLAPSQPQLTEPPDADPHVRWCGREVGESSLLLPIPIANVHRVRFVTLHRRILDSCDLR